MSYPALPFPATDEVKLSDWLEIYAIRSDDNNASIGDLERALQSSAVLESQGGHEAVESKCNEVCSELGDRTKSAKEAYPFEFDGRLLNVKSRFEDFPAYVFCLCLSTLSGRAAKSQPAFPRRAFEDLACIAARNYLCGESLRFASPRDELPKSFKNAVSELCKRVGEGKGYRQQPSLSRKDDTLDVVGWKSFADLLPGKLILFGQCASGSNWKSKLGELKPDAFCGQWMQENPVCVVLRAFFLPYRVQREEWEWLNRNAGIVFDRCRLSYWIHQEKKLKHQRELLRWCKSHLRNS